MTDEIKYIWMRHSAICFSLWLSTLTSYDPLITLPKNHTVSFKTLPFASKPPYPPRQLPTQSDTLAYNRSEHQNVWRSAEWGQGHTRAHFLEAREQIPFGTLWHEYCFGRWRSFTWTVSMYDRRENGSLVTAFSNHVIKCTKKKQAV